jgi:hypothetical protein
MRRATATGSAVEAAGSGAGVEGMARVIGGAPRRLIAPSTFGVDRLDRRR